MTWRENVPGFSGNSIKGVVLFDGGQAANAHMDQKSRKDQIEAAFIYLYKYWYFEVDCGIA